MYKQEQLISEPLYPYIEPHPWEEALFKSKPVRRLKHLSHFGGASFLSPVVHSRYEHTVGVWKLTARYFPDNAELRAAALLHDIGHLPFSHAIEEALGFNHHRLTEQYILEHEVSAILQKANIDSKKVVNLLNQPTAITGTGNILGLDHLDSFLRDTYMAGKISRLPRDLLGDIHCNSDGIETTLDTGNYLLQLILEDHKLFLSPTMVAVDRLLAEAVELHWGKITDRNREEFAQMTDADVLAILAASPSTEARELLHIIHYEPHRIKINSDKTGNGYPIGIRKIYSKVPLYSGSPLTEHSKEARHVLQYLKDLAFDLEVSIDPSIHA